MENFENKGLDINILKAIKELGFEKPTPIQEKTIPAILNNNNDLIALAQTGFKYRSNASSAKLYIKIILLNL